MKTLVLFYSYSGNAKRLAQACADKEEADLVEIKDVRRPGKIKAYTLGCFAAIRGRAWAIQAIEKDLSAYENLIIFSPVWASNPTPEVNALLEILPGGKTVSVKMVSGSGQSSCRERLEEKISAKGSKLESFEDIQA